MRCTKIGEITFAILLFSVVNFRIFASEANLKTLNRRNIIDDLRSLLGLKSSTPSTHATTSSIRTIGRITTTRNTGSTTKPVIEADYSFSPYENETSTANTTVNSTNRKNATTHSGLNANITITNLTNNSNITNLTNSSNITNLTNSSNITNLTNNSYITSIKNISNTSINNINGMQISTNKSLNPINSTLSPTNESASYLESTNVTNDNTSKISTGEVNNINIIANRSFSPQNQSLVTLNNATISESQQKNMSASSNQYATTPAAYSVKSRSTESNFILPAKPKVSNNSKSASGSNCSIFPNFLNTCQLPSKYLNENYSLTTFSDIEQKLSNFFLQILLREYCSIGEWCLGNSMDSLINSSLNISPRYCSSTFLSCIRSTEAEYKSCAIYKNFKAISDSLELVCKYKTLMGDDRQWENCGLHLMKLISVQLIDLKRSNSNKTNMEDIPCSSQKGYLRISFNCLLTQCPETFRLTLTQFEPWKWFTENRTEVSKCQPYYECVSSTIFWDRLSSTHSSGYYQMGESTTATSNTPKDQIEKENEPQHFGTHIFGNAAKENPGMLASLSAMIVILMIGMSVLIVVCWYHLKKNNRKRRGYSKLKTGDC